MTTPRRPRSTSFHSKRRPSQSSVVQYGIQADGMSDESSLPTVGWPHSGHQTRANSSTQLAGSPPVAQRIPTRSFYHRSFHGSLGMYHPYTSTFVNLLFKIRLNTRLPVYESRLQNWHLSQYLNLPGRTYLYQTPSSILPHTLK